MIVRIVHLASSKLALGMKLVAIVLSGVIPAKRLRLLCVPRVRLVDNKLWKDNMSVRIVLMASSRANVDSKVT